LKRDKGKESVVEKGKRILREHEEKKREIAKKFDPKQLVSKDLQTVYDEELGEIRFGQLTLKDSLEVGKAKTDEERSLLVLYHMLRKAYPDITLEDVENFPLDAATRLMTLMSQNIGFLASPQTPSPIGSKQTPQRS